MCWILSTVEDELLSRQPVGPTEGQLYRMEMLSWTLGGLWFRLGHIFHISKQNETEGDFKLTLNLKCTSV